MRNKLDSFEKQIRDTVVDIETPYSANAWEKISSQLPSQTYYPWKSFVAFISIAAVFSGLTYYKPKSQTIIENGQAFVVETLPVTQQNKLNFTANSEKNSASHDANHIVENISVNTDQSVTKSAPINSQVVAERKNNEEPSRNQNLEQETSNISGKAQENTLPLQISVDQSVICAGNSVQFTANQNAKFFWYLNGQELTSSTNLVYTFQKPGTYKVLASVVGQVSNEVQITVNPKPSAEFSYDEYLVDNAVPVVAFEAMDKGANKYSWVMDDGTTLSGKEVTHVYQKQNDYKVMLTVSNKFGCNAVVSKVYSLSKSFNLLAPGGFSPNNDGVNDTWFPQALNANYFSFSLKIYNRSNDEVFFSQSKDNQWDGTFNGKVANPGEVFFWKVIATDPNGIQSQFGGTISVMY